MCVYAVSSYDCLGLPRTRRAGTRRKKERGCVFQSSARCAFDVEKAMEGRRRHDRLGSATRAHARIHQVR